MPWNTGKPITSDKIKDTIRYIRENFEVLEALVDIIDDLETVSDLAADVEDLQSVSALSPHVSDLENVAALAPYVTALLSSRIVDHNLGAGSPNGNYIRWENGFQVCWSAGKIAEYNDNNRLLVTWTFPAQFADNSWVATCLPVWLSGDMSGYSSAGRGYYVDAVSKETTQMALWLLVSNASPGDTMHADIFAIGRWSSS